MLEINKKSNLLEQEVYNYSLQNVEEPNLYRELFPYSEIPKVSFNHRRVPMDMPDEIWITDTTFRDGQQSREPYTPEQILDLFDFMHRLGGEKGIIKQTEFFIYSEKDRKALGLCQERGYKFPEITTWIRCAKYDADVEAVGGLDLLLLGIGLNGHIGFNEPAVSYPVGSYLVELTEDTLEANSRFFSENEKQPTTAITMGIGQIFATKHILLLISGESKVDITKKLFENTLHTDIPACFLLLHPNVTLVIDKAANGV